MAACFLHETQQLSPSIAISAKVRAIRRLGEVLSSQARPTGDEAIAAVVKLANAGLSYGETEHICMHLSGLREMVQIRGGLSVLGMKGLLGQMIVT